MIWSRRGLRMIELPRPARLQGAAFYVKILIIIFLRIMALRAVQEAAYMRMVDLIIDKREGKTRARRTSLDTIQYIAVDRENGGRK